jgi:PAS domain-containing protein
MAMAGNRLPTREATLLRLDGREVAVEFHTAPLDFHGVREVLTIIRDITERKRAEEALRELNATLEAKVAQRTTELQHRTRQLQRLTLELSQAEDRERKRIADFLHEDLQQHLAGAKLHLNLLRR